MVRRQVGRYRSSEEEREISTMREKQRLKESLSKISKFKSPKLIVIIDELLIKLMSKFELTSLLDSIIFTFLIILELLY